MKHVLISLLAVSLFAGSASAALATEATQNQELEQDVKVECTTGSYGQNNTCTVNTNQKGRQEQKIVLRNGKEVKAHTPVAAGVDARMTALIGGLFVAGVATVVASKKLV